jgi:hypothetical protein
VVLSARAYEETRITISEGGCMVVLRINNRDWPPVSDVTHMKLLSIQDSATQNAPTQTPKRSDGLARSLGWFSIGLGLAQLIAPRALSRLIGVPSRPLIFALLGLREIASGSGFCGSGKLPIGSGPA